MIDTEFVFMDEYPELIEALRCAPSIEGHAMSLFVKPESLENFEKLFNEKYGGIYKLIPHARAVELFGGGSKHRMFDGFIGDFLAVAFGRVSIGYGYDPEPFKAAHGGLTRDELEIPLIAIKTKNKY